MGVFESFLTKNRDFPNFRGGTTPNLRSNSEPPYPKTDAELRIESFGGKMEQQAFMPLISNCRSLYLPRYEPTQWLSHITPSDNLQSVYITENCFNDPLDICLEAIVEFLFKPMNNHKSRKLQLRSVSNQSELTLINAIKKKFLEAIVPVVFTLEWNPYDSWVPILSADTNHRTGQKLRFHIYYPDFFRPEVNLRGISLPPVYILDVDDF
ncbi:hypothetical protein Ddc_08382 [Ditylenchus destructor]|nr:hypothetical protein Ddc_08382 [Ditylenchus destructor]